MTRKRRTGAGGRSKEPVEEKPQVLSDGHFEPADPNNPLAKFSDIQQQIIRKKFENRNLNQVEIGKLLDLSRSAVNFHFRNAELMAIVAWLDKDTYGKIDELRDLSLTTALALLRAGTTPDWLKASISRDFYMPAVLSKVALPSPPIIAEISFTDPSQPDKPPEKI